jgi:hypothetical protein
MQTFLVVQITTFNISLVVHGAVAENMDFMKVIFMIIRSNFNHKLDTIF